MNRNHETLLMDYATGTLDTAHSILVASYLTLSPEGRHYVAECEALGGALIEHLCECVEMSNTCLEAVLARIETEQHPCADTASCIQACIQGCASIPQPLARFLPADAAKPHKWRRALSGSEWIDLTFPDNRSYAQLIRCKPGFVLPRHIHRNSEITLVLDGAFEDSTGRYARGDLVIMENAADHKPIADAQTGCMIISITTRPARFTGFLKWF